MLVLPIQTGSFNKKQELLEKGKQVDSLLIFC